jgi:hypothetical protein
MMSLVSPHESIAAGGGTYAVMPLSGVSNSEAKF